MAAFGLPRISNCSKNWSMRLLAAVLPNDNGIKNYLNKQTLYVFSFPAFVFLPQLKLQLEREPNVEMWSRRLSCSTSSRIQDPLLYSTTYFDKAHELELSLWVEQFRLVKRMYMETKSSLIPLQISVPISFTYRPDEEVHFFIGELVTLGFDQPLIVKTRRERTALMGKWRL